MQSDSVFKDYASAYDTLYQEKDYARECDFLEQIFRRHDSAPVQNILDMGCGTGGHAIPLVERGYHVTGIDRSPEMVALARRKAENANAGERLRLEVVGIQSAELGETFDAAVCMFAVLGYQTTNAQVFAALRTARKHLKPGGLFVCDVWYGPAVLSQRPTGRVKEIRNGEERTIRLAQPTLDTQGNTVAISYHLFHLRGCQLVDETQEIHLMRFFFQPELEFFMGQAGLRLAGFCPFLALDQPVSENTWNVTAIAQTQ